MGERLLKEWQIRRLTPSLREGSAAWRIEAREPDVGAVLGPIRGHLPNCCAVVGIDALSHLAKEPRNRLLSAPHAQFDVEWLPGDEDFGRGQGRRSTIIGLDQDDIAPLYPFFLGLDPRCLLLFSAAPITPQFVAANLATAESHLAALNSLLGPGVAACYPALDGDVLVFVTAGDEALSKIMGEGL